MHMLRNAILSCFIFAFSLSPAFADKQVRKTLTWEGKTREYFVHTPDQLPAGNTLPLVLVLHGGGAKSGGDLRDSYGFKKFIDGGAFIAVYPTAIDGSWAIGGAPTANVRVRPDHDDAGFLDAALTEVIANYPVDTSRLFVTGASRGGFMTQWYVPRSRYAFAGAGTVITSMFRNISQSFDLKQPMTWVMMIGDKDPFMPYDGKRGDQRPDDLLPVEDIIALINRANGLSNASPKTSALGNPNGRRSCGNEMRVWENTAKGAKTVLVRVTGGSHVMFGSWQCKDFNHADEMWAFFKTAQPRPQSGAPAAPMASNKPKPSDTSKPSGDRFYGREAFTIVSKQTGTEFGTVTEHARQWGRARVEVYDTTVKLGAAKLPKRERKIFDRGRVTTINDINGKKSSARAPAYNRVIRQMKNKPADEAGAVIMASVGGMPTGKTGSFAGHDCTYYKNDAIGTRACVTPWGGTLHLIVKLGAIEVDRRATEVRMGEPGPDSAYSK